MFRVALGLALSLVSSSAFAQAICSGFLGRIVNPVSIEEVFEKFQEIGPKGEFETTKDYRRRLSAARGASYGPLIIRKEPEDRKYFKYDPDAGILSIQPWVFSNRSVDMWSAIYKAGFSNRIKASQTSNISAVISRDEAVVGKYIGGNAYGAKIQVTKFRWSTKAIFDRPGEGEAKFLFPERTDRSGKELFVGHIRLSPSEARRLKPLLKLAIVAEPREPYVVSGTHRVGKPTISDPTDVTEDFELLIADIKCGLLLDPDNRVLGAYPTN